MRDSIVINMKFADYDIIDGTPLCERHHLFGAANRDKATEDGLWVPLTAEHHRGKMSVHNNKEMKALSHILGQYAWMFNYLVEQKELPFEDVRAEAIEAFRARYGKSYI